MTEKLTQILIPKGEWEKDLLTTFQQANLPIVFQDRALRSTLPGLPHRSNQSQIQ